MDPRPGRSDKLDAAKRYTDTLDALQVLTFVLRESDDPRKTEWDVFGNRDCPAVALAICQFKC